MFKVQLLKLVVCTLLNEFDLQMKKEDGIVIARMDGATENIPEVYRILRYDANCKQEAKVFFAKSTLNVRLCEQCLYTLHWTKFPPFPLPLTVGDQDPPSNTNISWSSRVSP